MKYLCLGYLDMESFDNAPEAEKSEILRGCMAQCVPFRASGKVIAEEGLEHINLAKTIRPRKGKISVTDGPFIETKEQIGSFFIVEGDTMEEAIAAASLHPAAIFGEDYGFGIEIRPIQ